MLRGRGHKRVSRGGQPGRGNLRKLKRGTKKTRIKDVINEKMLGTGKGYERFYRGIKERETATTCGIGGDFVFSFLPAP
jgi:hypothetical protein